MAKRIFLFLVAAFFICFATVARAQTCAPTPSGLVDFWPGDNSDNDFQGTNNGAPENGGVFVDGKVGPAFNFDGTNTVLIPSINAGSTFSIELWVYPTRTAGFEHLVSNAYTSSANYGALYFLNNHIEYWQGATVRASTPTSSVPLNQWTHVALTYNGSVAQLYLNGVASGSPSVVHAETFNNALRFGYTISNSDTTFAGRLDEISLYNTALSAADILSIFNAGSIGKCVAPALLINDTSVIEGNSGTTPMNFTVTSLRASAAAMASYTTADGTAMAPSDYVTASGTVNIPANSTATITVLVNGDTMPEQNETLFVNLSNPVNAGIEDAQGIGTIYSDDCGPAPLGLADWYKAEGNGIDSVGGNNGTLENGVTFATGYNGQAFSFDGINDSVLTPLINFGSSFSVELWIYPTRSNGGYENLVSNTDSFTATANYGSFYYHNDHLEYWEGGFLSATSPATLPLNTWTHVALTYNGSVIQIYVNGVTSGNPSVTHTETFNTPVRFGYSAQNRDQYFKGRLDEISLYNRALTAAEVQSVYAQGGGGKCGLSGDIWTGAVSSNWNTAGNWSGGVPSASTDVVIPAIGVSNEPIISISDVTVNSLNTAAGRTLTINSGRTLNVNNDLINGSLLAGSGAINSQGAVTSNSGIISVTNFNFNRAGAQTFSGSGSFSNDVAQVMNGSTLTLSSDYQFSSLTIQNGATLDISSRTMRVSGNLTNSGTFTSASSIVVANGTAPQTLTGANYYSLTANNASGVMLGSNATVTNLLTLTSDLQTGPFVLTMPYQTQDTAGPGDVVGNFRLTSPNNFPSRYGNFFNRITIAGVTPPTDITVNLVKSAPADFTSAVQRTYTITPNGGSGYVATVRLHYLDAELNGNDENAMYLWRRGTSWSALGFTSRNTTENWVEKTGVTQFSPWTFASTTSSITGTITYGNAIPAGTRFVSNVLLSGAGSPSVTGTTGFPDGVYFLAGFGPGAYTITPTKTTGQNNITSFDAGKIAQHVAAISLLTGNQLIVADVSNNGSISSFDAAEIANYVVVSSPSGQTGNWRFSPANRPYASISTNVTGEDYSALLMGEVSGNWSNTGARPANPGGPERKTSIKAPYMAAPANGEILIPVKVEGAINKGIIAYEFDLRYDSSVIQPQANPIDLAGTVSGKLSFAANAEEPGLLRVAVYGPLPIDENGTLLNLRFTAVGAPGSASPLTWERIMFNEGDPWAVSVDGQVTLSAATPNHAAISGQLRTVDGYGIRNAKVVITGDSLNHPLVATTGSFGYYSFNGLVTGETYVITVNSKRYTFSTPSRVVSLVDNIADADFVADPQE